MKRIILLLLPLLAMATTAVAQTTSASQSAAGQTLSLKDTYFERRSVAHIHTGKKGGGKTIHILLCPLSTGSEDLKKIISAIYWVDENVIKYSPYDPPIVTGLVYHDIGKDKEFCSVEMIKTRYKNGEMFRYRIRERVDDETAQLLIDFLAGETQWRNSTDINFYVSDGIRLPSPELLDQ